MSVQPELKGSRTSDWVARFSQLTSASLSPITVPGSTTYSSRDFH